ncbi:ABC transporter permease [Pikeienuella piscinae]|uniref:ABC transporter permease n=1 Tax=Pikeienuella piscinae TaxID=2748098 RepID=A0A7M3T7E6_9RHOB|nr:ABC transporter permease [Pikeienuella piscinae]
MLRALLKKIARSILTLWLVVTFAFVVLRLSGDPALAVLSDQAMPESVLAFREAWGLDLPIHQQYLAYLKAVLTGDFGVSYASRSPVTGLIAERAPMTLLLMGLSLLLMLAIGIPAGVLAAVRRNSFIDRLVMGLVVLAHGLPSYVTGILLILVFTVQLRLLPGSGAETPLSLIMPVITIGASGAAVIARYCRSSMLEVLNRPFITAAVAKGVSPRRVLWRHAFPNAAIPLITIIGFIVGGLIGGAAITETIFGWPGLGRLLVASVQSRDLAVVQALLLLIAACMVVANLTVDLLYGWLDPRTRHGSSPRNQ